jgi:hypothetical protein
MNLPPGVHAALLEEVEEHFARFQKSDRRIKLFQKLCDYLAAVKKTECGTSVILDGSFIMACVDEPDDIDLILILPRNWDAAADLKPYQYNLVSKRRVKKVVRKQLALVEHALEDLRQDVLPKNKRNFEVFSEGYVDQIAELKAEIDSYAAASARRHRS